MAGGFWRGAKGAVGGLGRKKLDSGEYISRFAADESKARKLTEEQMLRSGRNRMIGAGAATWVVGARSGQRSSGRDGVSPHSSGASTMYYN